MENIFHKITSIDNIRLGYFDLIRKLDESSISKRYKGVDGMTINDIDFCSEKVIRDIREEMIELREISPVYLVQIPKKNGEKRRVYVYTVRDRIKAEAIYRILEPIVDRLLSDCLFSYRSSHPSYYAARSAVRRYRRYHGEDYVFVTDIHDYTDTIDHYIMMDKIRNLNIDDKTKGLLELFIKVRINIGGKSVSGNKGIITGVPITGLMANLYLNEFDIWAGKKVALYRRVGDDMIAMDRNIEKIKVVREKFINTTNELKLNINRDKTSIIKNTQEFKFLGYRFKDGLIGFDGGSIDKADREWKRYFINISRGKYVNKIKRLRKANRGGVGDPDYEFKRLIEQKILIDDTDQIKDFSDKIIRYTSRGLFGKDDHGGRVKAKRIMEKVGIRTLFDHYQFSWNKWKRGK